MITEVITYLRVSTKEQGLSGLGLDGQRHILSHFMDKDKLVHVKEFVEVQSGKDIRNRPVLEKAINFCKKNNTKLMVAKLDRLSRDVEHTFKIIKRIGEGNFISADLPSSDSLTISIFAGLSQREAEIVSLRTKLALRVLKRKGVKLGTPSNLTNKARAKGREEHSLNARLNENNVKAQVVIKSLRENGKTIREIVDELNKNNFKSARGGRFHASSVFYLLKRC